MPDANSIFRPEAVQFNFATYRNGQRTRENVCVFARSIEEAAARASEGTEDRPTVVLAPVRTCVLTGRERDSLKALLQRLRDVDPNGDVEFSLLSATARKLLCEVSL